jgi:hypothetical protein
MRRNGHVESVGDFGDAFAFHDPARFGQIGHNDVTGFALEQFEELKAGIVIFAGADDGAGGGFYLRQGLDIFRRNRLFQSHQPQIFDRFAKGDSRGQVELAVAVNRQIGVEANGLADGVNQVDDVAHLFGSERPINRVELANAGVIHVEFDGGVTFFNHLHRFVRIGLRVVRFPGMAVGVETKFSAIFTAQKLVNRDA